MERKQYEIEGEKPFGESLIWQLNRDYYDTEGVKAWSSGVVPHHLTSNSMVGKTYAELIFAFLKDLASKGQNKEKVYILELGAGHGRLAFHTLKHLERLTEQVGLNLPPYCYILSDIVEDNLAFFYTHPQFRPYFEAGLLDLTYFDAVGSTEIYLRHSCTKILANQLSQPILVIANYFFDSIPNDLFHFKNRQIGVCSVGLQTDIRPELLNTETLLKTLKLVYTTTPVAKPFYKKTILNEILEDYRDLVFNTYLFFPKTGIQCLQNLQEFSQKGMMLLSIDKGHHEIPDLENGKEPEMAIHGSMSFSVNYHALGAYCTKQGGKAYFPKFSTFDLQLGCLLFLSESENYTETQAAYERVVNSYGPDDFNSYKKFVYQHINTMKIPDLIGFLRLSAYDSTVFQNILPRIKQLSGAVTFNERKRLAQTMRKTWDMYFTINESTDISFEIGGIFYQLGFYEDALVYFGHSRNLFGDTADVFYNKALCYYQLRKDDLFVKTLKEAKLHFPSVNFGGLEKLDLGAI